MAATLLIIIALVISITINVLILTRKKVSDQNRSIRTTILAGIQNVSELATIRERFQSIVSFSDGVKIPGLNMNIPGTTKKFMLKYYGTITCGCDLSKAKVSEKVNNKVTITLPSSEILDVYADVHSFEVYDQRVGIFTSIKLDDQNREVEADLEKVKAHEIQNGILEHSNENVKRILTSVVATAGAEAEIIFTEKEQNVLTDSSKKILQIEAKIEE